MANHNSQKCPDPLWNCRAINMRDKLDEETISGGKTDRAGEGKIFMALQHQPDISSGPSKTGIS